MRITGITPSDITLSRTSKALMSLPFCVKMALNVFDFSDLYVENQFARGRPYFAYPYPLSRNYHLATVKTQPDSLPGIWLVDAFDNLTLVAECADGILADLKVCTSDTGQDVWSEMVVYDEHGHELWVSEVSDRLSGPWEFELKNVYGNGDRVQKYVVDVVEDKEMEIDTVYDRLGCTRDDFCTMLLQEIEDGITSEYSAKIADAIADKVAVDVMETADQKEWNTCDISLGVGRVLLKTLGIDV